MGDRSACAGRGGPGGAWRAAAIIAVLIVLAPAAAYASDDVSPPETGIVSEPSGTQRSGIASFTFSSSETPASFECRLDGGAFVACDSSSTLQVANGSHVLEVRAVDAGGNVDPTPESTSWWADALLPNGTFETTTRGWADQGYPTPAWKPYNAAIEVVDGGFGGGKALLVRAGSGTVPTAYTSPRPINSTVAGRTYSVRGYVRSESPGKQVCLRMREYSAKSMIGNSRTCKKTTGSWSEIGPLSYTAGQSGAEIDVDVHQSSAISPGDSFLVDALALADGQPQAVQPVPEDSGDPVLLAAADVAICRSTGDEAVSRLLDTLSGTIAIPGDTEQNTGRPDEYAGCYDPTWGRHRPRTMPAVGDHEYHTTDAAGYFGYFGDVAGDPGKGWYSYDRGAWHIVVLNSNCAKIGGCGQGSEQYEWLADDLEQHGDTCIGAYFHYPLFSAGGQHGGKPSVRPFWRLLHQHGAEWVLGGNDHNYQRFAPQSPDGELDTERGIRQFVVGTGGASHYKLGTPLPNTEVQNSGTFGVLRLTLHASSYEWEFIPQEGRTFTDYGSTACSSAVPADVDPPETTIDSAPSGTTNVNSATIAFSATESGATFECSLDAGAFMPCTSPASYAGLTNGEHTVAVRARDAAGNVDASPAVATWFVDVPPPPPDLLPNGSFESGLTGWYKHKATLSSLSGGPAGQQHARVGLSANQSATYAIITNPPPVGTHGAGERYESRAWLRSDVPGKSVCLRIREWSETRAVGGAQKCMATKSSWASFPTVSYTTVGGTSIEVYAYQSSAADAGDSFDVDGVTFTRQP